MHWSDVLGEPTPTMLLAMAEKKESDGAPALERLVTCGADLGTRALEGLPLTKAGGSVIGEVCRVFCR